MCLSSGFCARFVSQGSLWGAFSVCLFIHWSFYDMWRRGKSWHKLFKRLRVPESLRSIGIVLPLQGVKTIHEFIHLPIPLLASLAAARFSVNRQQDQSQEEGNRWKQTLVAARYETRLTSTSDQKHLHSSESNFNSNPPTSRKVHYRISERLPNKHRNPQ